MTETEEILLQYRQADEDRRLGLYMHYRELRGEFQEMEQEEAAGGCDALPA